MSVQPSAARTVIAAFVPLFLPLVAFLAAAAFVDVSVETIAESLVASGVWGLLVGCSIVACMFVLAVLLPLIVRSTPIPPVLTLLVAVAPWLTSILTMGLLFHRALAASAYVHDFGSKGTLLAAGFAEALFLTLPAGVASAALLTACAVAFLNPGMSTDRTRSRLAALASVVLAVALIVAWRENVAHAALGQSQVLEDPSARAAYVALAIPRLAFWANLRPWITWLGLVVIFLASLIVLVRGGFRLSRSIFAIAITGFVAIVMAAHVLAHGMVRREATARVALPWSDVQEFRPSTLDSESSMYDLPHALLTTRGVRFRDRASLSPFDAATLAPKVRRAMEAEPRWRGASRSETPGGSADRAVHGNDDPSQNSITSPRSFVLAADARVPASALASVLQAAERAGARSVRAVGQVRSSHPAIVRDVRNHAPWLVPAFLRTVEVQVLLPNALPSGYADSDPLFLHASVGRGKSVLVKARAGASQSPFVLGDARGSRPAEPRDGTVIFLKPEPTATAEAVFIAAAHVAALGYDPLVVRDYPTDPRKPSAAPSNAPTTGWQQTLATAVRSQSAAVRFCYERELVRQPDLAGRVDVEFVAHPDGSARAVRVLNALPESMAECVVRAVSRLELPPFQGSPIGVRYPYIFMTPIAKPDE